MGELILRDILLIFLVTVPVVLLLRLARLPPIIGFILTGALIGPSGLGLIHEAEQINILADVGVTLLLFSIGLEFSLAHFAKHRTHVMAGGFFQITLCILSGGVVGFFADWPLHQGIYFGCIMALSSTAAVLGSLIARRMNDSVPGRVATGILILQDLAVVPMMAFLPLLGKAGGFEAGAAVLEKRLAVLAVLAVVVFFFIRYLAGPLLRRVSGAKSREVFLITVITFALGMAWLTDRSGLSFALGAFLGGLIVGSTEYQVEALAEIRPLRYGFNSLFFVSIGMLVDLPYLAQHAGLVLFFCLLIPGVKMVLIAGILLLLRVPVAMALSVGIMLGQIGEFSFLLAQMGYRSGALDSTIYHVTVSAAAVTMIFTPLMVPWALPISAWFARLPGLKRLAAIKAREAGDVEQMSLRRHVIICGFGPLGEALGRFLDEYKIPHLILELNLDTIHKMREEGKNVFYGDGASEEVLFRSGIEQASLLALATPDFFNNAAAIKKARRLSPDIKIITRAKYRREVEGLYQAGADVVISEELEGGIEMGRTMLKELGIPPNDVDNYISGIRDFGSADFF